MYPSNWTANALTVIGNLTMPVAGMIFIYLGGTGFQQDEKDPNQQKLPLWTHLIAAFAVYWFSIGDGIDGQRARRLKCGTPVGRLVDEASDPY